MTNPTIAGVPESLTRDVPHPLGLGIVGSTAYGMAGPSSDVDRYGVYIEDTVAFLGLSAPTRSSASIVRHNDDGDVQWQEIGKFIALALSGNPTINELLWIPDALVEHTTPTFELLRSMRATFLGAKPIMDAYMGFAVSQVGRIERGAHASRTDKAARHMLRLVDQGYHAYTTGELKVAVDDPQRYLDFGTRALADPSIVRPELERAQARIAAATPGLPIQPDREAANATLVAIRLEYLHRTGDAG